MKTDQPRCWFYLNRVFAAALFASASLLFGQSTTGAISGTVQDSSGANIPGAAVKLINSGTGSEQASVSDASGNFAFLQLLPGTYTLEVNSTGFKTLRHEGLVVEPDRSMTVPVALTVGGVTETVEVSGGTPLLEPNTSSVGTTVETQKLADLPLPANNIFGLMDLIPTVKTSAFFGVLLLTNSSNSSVEIGGGTLTHNGWMLDGIINNKMGDATGPMISLPKEDVAEIRVITNAFAAEYGYSSGGITSVISKSGTNDYHGSLYEYLRNSDTSSKDFFTNLAGAAKAQLVLNQFGGGLGGPLKKNKVFFYIDTEIFKQRISTNQIENSPTALQRVGNFSQTLASNGQEIVVYDPETTVTSSSGVSTRMPFSGNVIPPDRLSAISQAVFSLYPLPNLPGLQYTQANNLFLTTHDPLDSDTWGGKVDYLINSNQRLAVRYTRQQVYWYLDDYFNNLLDVNARRFAYIPRQSGSIEYNNTLSPTLLLEVRTGVGRDYDQGYAPATTLGGFNLTSWGFPAAFQAQQPVYKFATTGLTPQLTIADTGVPGSATVGGGTPEGRSGLTQSNAISLTKIKSAHTFKMGYDFVFYAFNPFDGAVPQFSFSRAFTQGPNATVASATAGYGVASFELGYPATGTETINPSNTKSRHLDAVFFQDDWKVSRKLTLNLGLRWEYESPQTDRNNVFSNFNPALVTPSGLPNLNLVGGLTFAGVAGDPRTDYDATYNHWGPRFGFAYQALSKLVVRGGYGISWEPENGVAFAQYSGFQSSTTMVTSLNNGLTPYNTISNPFPNGLNEPTNSALGGLTGIGTSIEGQLRNLQQGYAQEWNLTLQFQPINNLLIEAAYLGNEGTHLQGGSRTLDQLPDQYLALGNALNQQVPNPYLGLVSTGPLSATTITRQQSLLPYPQFVAVSGGWDNLGYSSYHAATLKVERRLSRGVSILGAYTFEKLIDGVTNGAQDWYDLAAEKSTSINDIPQRLVINGSWIPQFFKDAKGWRRQVETGWQVNTIITVQKGTPINFGVSSRPNVVPGCNVRVADPTIYQWFNTACFTAAAPFTFGDSSRTIPGIYGPGIFNIDMSVFKDFFVGEKINLQFRAAAFNLTNTPQFQNPGATVNSSTFGVVTATGLSGSVYEPEAREMQFALQLRF